jgi:hypothetical protein
MPKEPITGKRRGGPQTPGGSFETASGPPQDERVTKKRGGGPKTPEGKAAVRLNPVRHGVLGGPGAGRR